VFVCVSPYIVFLGNSLYARQCVSKHVPMAMNTHATIEELLYASLSIQVCVTSKERRQLVLPRTSCLTFYSDTWKCKIQTMNNSFLTLYSGSKSKRRSDMKLSSLLHLWCCRVIRLINTNKSNFLHQNIQVSKQRV
jgi:hypothetical protein